MKTGWRGFIVCELLLSLGIVCSARAQCPPEMPAPLVQTNWGLAGLQPGFVVPVDNPAGATISQVEFWKMGATRTTRFAQVWADFPYPSSKVFWRDWNSGAIFLRGAGPGGIRNFPNGNYGVRYRGYNKNCDPQYGPWSPWTYFTMAPVNNMAITFTSAPPAVVGLTGDLSWKWTNSFAAGSYVANIRQGNKVVRNQKLAGGFGWNYGYFVPGLDRGRLTGSSYQDRPENINKELPTGTGYVFRVKAYSPIARKWSAWTTNGPFAINRGPATNIPVLSISQIDPMNNSTKSLRPFFRADYGAAPALWSYFVISRLNESGKPSVVRKQWISRYAQESYGYIGGSGSKWATYTWHKDLKPGTYVFSNRVWNGKGPGQSAWTPAITQIVTSAGRPIPPDPTTFGLYSYSWSSYAYLSWQPSPNAYAYKYRIYRDGKLFKTSTLLDHAKGKIWMESEKFRTSLRLPKGVYTFSLQAVNMANQVGQQYSDWSAQSPVFNTLPAGISGKVTGPDGTTPLKGIYVFVGEYTGDGWSGRAVYTDSNGKYFLKLEPGTYRILFDDNASGGYVCEAYDNASWLDGGQDVVVAPGTVVSNINASLAYED